MRTYRCGAWWCPSEETQFSTWDGTAEISVSNTSIHSKAGDSGDAISPWLRPDFSPHELVVSWNSSSSSGGAVEVFAQLRFDDTRVSDWLSFGRWSTDPAVSRGSRANQTNQQSRVLTDTVVCTEAFSAFRIRVALKGKISVLGVSATWSDLKSIAFETTRMNTEPLSAEACIVDDVPTCSQMVYPDGGNTWCSPTSLAMVMEYWNKTGRGCAECIHETRTGVYDPVYSGHGNWAFNVAWAGELGFTAGLVRFPDLKSLEPWIRAGIPLVLSVAWNNETGPVITNAPVTRSNGHLTVLVGFDEDGNAVMNEPASPSDDSVRRTYDRHELERCWLRASGGLCYVVHPKRIPPNSVDYSGGKAAIIAS